MTMPQVSVVQILRLCEVPGIRASECVESVNRFRIQAHGDRLESMTGDGTTLYHPWITAAIGRLQVRARGDVRYARRRFGSRFDSSLDISSGHVMKNRPGSAAYPAGNAQSGMRLPAFPALHLSHTFVSARIR